MGLIERLAAWRPIASIIKQRVNLAIRALDDARDRAYSSTTFPRDRKSHDRTEVLQDALDAWRDNPLARRIVQLTTQYVVGAGITPAADDPATNAFILHWWNHPLNHMTRRVFEWCDELTRAGNLFIVLTTDSTGMTYVRAIPAAQVEDINSAPNDVEQLSSIRLKPSNDQPEPAPIPAADRTRPHISPAVLHFPINRPIGAQWGEPDLAPVTRWLARYANWLEDRVRLNRYRNFFLWILKGKFNNAAQRLARQAELNANPPNPGTIYVIEDTEEWKAEAPHLASFEANADGLAIKKMAAAGSGTPLHFLAEPESATRTTADAAGGPTYRHYEQRQLVFADIITQVIRHVLSRAANRNQINPDANVTIATTDISPRDNAALAIAAINITSVATVLRNRRIIDDEELLRLVYKFSGEPPADIAAMLKRGADADPPITTESPAPPARGPEIEQ